ncbi:MAG: pyruvate, phosphate dikinase [Acidimicrobiia bacterium]|nr:pyruvate, phosphate dikinase [Acidimicrobiia bacterium]NNL69765.1 pyruvate, phosphate dikinase [Acidimicrobiia bacterium]
MTTKWVYAFDEIEEAESYVGGDWEAVRALLGGKGANLGEMTRIGVPVPPGFTVTTEACNAYLAAGEEFPGDMWEQVLQALKSIEQKTGKTFGSVQDPLLVSCRSGAKFSMPGMMDTVLNIGLNTQVIDAIIERTGDPHFVYDSFRRLIQMFGSVVLGVRDEPFEEVLLEHRRERGVQSDAELTVEDLKEIVVQFKDIVRRYANIDFPADPYEQLRMATEAVFKSWNGKRARDYRNAANIPHDLGTGVNVQTMVFGNMGEDSATGVAMSRNATTGEPHLEGDFLINAQGEDVVAGTRPTEPISALQAAMPGLFEEFQTIATKLENHYRNMQDMEFTIEHGKLWLLQTRDGKRTAQAAVRIAVDMAESGLIDKKEAIGRVTPDQVDFFLHPQFSAEGKRDAELITTGLNVSPGAAVGMLAFTADLAERWAKDEGRSVIMVRPETKPDDVHGMLAAEGILTSSGGRTSHAALVARQFGKPAVVGASELEVDVAARTMTIGEQEIHEGDWVSIDGTTGEVYLGQIDTLVPNIQDPYLMKLLEWADEFRTLGVWANADYPADAERARSYGAEGIGLCRTEHMFFEQERLPIVQRMITTKSSGERREAVDALLPFQREDFAGLFRVMDGLPVIIRLIDPPLHEFLPGYEELTSDLADLKIRLSHATDLSSVDELLAKVTEESTMLDRVEALREANPMLGTRGVRLGILMPALTRMQVRAIFEAACEVTREGIEVHPEVMIPLTSHVNELKRQREVLEAEAQAVMEEQDLQISYKFGTMIEIPRAALTADEIAEYAEFLSFGTNDLTQTTFGISRDDAESGFLIEYLSEGILPANPFATIDTGGVGRLMRMAVDASRDRRPDIEVGICGEHGGDPESIAFCNTLGLNYVSCSPYRVPVARLAAAQAEIAKGDGG